MLKVNYKLSFLLSVLFLFITIVSTQSISAKAEGTNNSIGYSEQDLSVKLEAGLKAGYEIDDYNIKVNVNSNNVLEVTETIKVNFLAERHGIYRVIPLTNKVTHTINGTAVVKNYRSSVNNISVMDGATGKAVRYKATKEGDNLVLKIGDPKKTIIGSETYVIGYKFLRSGDDIKEFDEFYYNLIGSDWETVINNASFVIHMPAAFDKSSLEIFSGPLGSKASSKLQSTVNGNTITGKINKMFYPKEAVTIKLMLPEGYFTITNDNDGRLWIIIFAVFSFLSVLLFFIFGRDSKLQVRIEGLPEEYLNPAEVGYILGGGAKSKGITALILYWADKGYLSIESEYNEQLTLIKLKNADEEMKSYEKLMFNKLFEAGDRAVPEDLKLKFYKTITKVQKELHKSFKNPNRRIYKVSGNVVQWISYAFAALCTAVVLGKTVFTEISYGFGASNIGDSIAGILMITIFTVTSTLAVGYFAERSRRGAKAGLVFMLIVYLVLLLLIIAMAEYSVGHNSLTYCGIFAAAICGITGVFSKKLTSQGRLWLEKLLGFKRFLELTEKNQIHNLVAEKPQLFYHMIPYAYTMGMSSKLGAIFEGLIFSPPDWYYGEADSAFNFIFFMNILDKNVGYYESSMNMSSSQSSSGGDGGGAAGGGDGGGGGGSW